MNSIFEPHIPDDEFSLSAKEMESYRKELEEIFTPDDELSLSKKEVEIHIEKQEIDI